jgi:hypothetical protein
MPVSRLLCVCKSLPGLLIVYAADENIAIDAAEQNENLAIEYMPDVHDDTPNVDEDDNSNVED